MRFAHRATKSVHRMRPPAFVRGGLRRALEGLGYEVRRRAPERTQAFRLGHIFAARDINLVLDVGANVGRFARSVFDLGFGGRVISFEPTSDAHARLSESARQEPRWMVAQRMALGSTNGEIEIKVAGNSVSSSVLDMMPVHVERAPRSAYQRAEQVPIRRLDSLDGAYAPAPDDRVLLKADVQGYEREVVEGARGILPQIEAMQLELSFVELYRRSTLFLDMLTFLRDLGFEMHSMTPAMTDPVSGRMLQAMGLFLSVRQ